MSWRRVGFAFAITFVSALLVFTLPRFVFNTMRGATVPTPAQDTAKPQVAAPAPPAPPVTSVPRSLGSRLTGIFGLILILGIGVALSRNRRAIRGRVAARGVRLQLPFPSFVLRGPIRQTIFRCLVAVVTTILGLSYAGSELLAGET